MAVHGNAWHNWPGSDPVSQLDSEGSHHRLPCVLRIGCWMPRFFPRALRITHQLFYLSAFIWTTDMIWWRSDRLETWRKDDTDAFSNPVQTQTIRNFLFTPSISNIRSLILNLKFPNFHPPSFTTARSVIRVGGPEKQLTCFVKWFSDGPKKDSRWRTKRTTTEEQFAFR